MIDRRAFLKSMASLTTGILLSSACAEGGEEGTASDRLGTLLPTRRFGRTGEAVTMLGVGGWHIGEMSEAEAQKRSRPHLKAVFAFLIVLNPINPAGVRVASENCWFQNIAMMCSL